MADVRITPKLSSHLNAFWNKVSPALRNTSLRKDAQVHLVVHSMAITLAHSASREVEPYQPRGFSGFDRNKLFYRSVCFHQCHLRSGPVLPKVICNTVLPHVTGFASAFNCKPGQPLFTDTPWSL